MNKWIRVRSIEEWDEYNVLINTRDVTSISTNDYNYLTINTLGTGEYEIKIEDINKNDLTELIIKELINETVVDITKIIESLRK